MARLLSVVPYLLPLVVFVGAAADLFTDWDKYKNSKLKTLALLVLILICFLTIAGQYHDNQEKAASDGQIQNLEGQTKAANDAQRDNTKLFITSFNDLHGELSDLKTQIKTEPLEKKADAFQRKLESVQADLEATQIALNGPKATLLFSFMDMNRVPLLQPVTEVTIPTDSDGNVNVEFTLLNPTEVDAVGVEINLGICDMCKFAKEPQGFTKLVNEPETVRDRTFPVVSAKSFLETMSADITVPPPYSTTQVVVKYRCRTCVLPKQNDVGIIQIVRETIQMRRDVLQLKKP